MAILVRYLVYLFRTFKAFDVICTKDAYHQTVIKLLDEYIGFR